MLVIGILGGVASGKSLVASQLARLGAVVLNADRTGHEVLFEPDVVAAIRDRWGETVLAADGRVDRKAVGAIVFGPPPDGPANLRFLEKVTHPRIGQRLQDELEALRHRGTCAAVLDAPVMLKAGWNRFCDRIVFVEVERALRIERARQRGWSESEFEARESAQESLEEKRRFADCVIDNSGSPEETFAQVERFWNSLGRTA